MESEEGAAEKEKHLKMVHYYYINYKQFVNVVKYKLDQMRKKIEAEERKVLVQLLLKTHHTINYGIIRLS